MGMLPKSEDFTVLDVVMPIIVAEVLQSLSAPSRSVVTGIIRISFFN